MLCNSFENLKVRRSKAVPLDAAFKKLCLDDVVHGMSHPVIAQDCGMKTTSSGSLRLDDCLNGPYKLPGAVGIDVLKQDDLKQHVVDGCDDVGNGGVSACAVVRSSSQSLPEPAQSQ